MKVASTHLLANTALYMVTRRFRTRLSQPINEDYVRFSLDALNSQLVITSLDYSATGEIGRYKGEARVSYGKARLDLVLPHPLVYPEPYPTTWRALKAALWDLYSILLEEGEFALSSAPTHGLVGDDPITLDPSASNSILELIALPASGRFATGTTLRLQVVGNVANTHLNDLIALPRTADLARITDAQHEQYFA